MQCQPPRWGPNPAQARVQYTTAARKRADDSRSNSVTHVTIHCSVCKYSLIYIYRMPRCAGDQYEYHDLGANKPFWST